MPTDQVRGLKAHVPRDGTEPRRGLPGFEPLLTLSIARRADGRVSLIENRGGVVIAEMAIDPETARWAAGG